MKVAHIVCVYPPYNGGMGTVAFHMAEALGKRGHEVCVYTPGPYGGDEVREKGEDHAAHTDKVKEAIHDVKRIVPNFRYGNAARLPGLEDELANYDIVHLHYPFFGTAGLIKRFRDAHPDVPLVVSYHMDARADGWKGAFFALYNRLYMHRVLNRADALIGSSEDYITHSFAAAHAAEYSEKWYYIPFGVDTGRFQPAERDAALCRVLGLDCDAPILLFVGGMDDAHYFKGVPDLLEAMAQLRDTAVQLLLVGDGNMRPQFQQMASAMGVKATFLGRVDDDELPMHYQLADLCILPSTTQGEAFGMVLIEAMASGVPVLASDMPGVRDVAMRAGDVFPAGDIDALAEAILRYLSSDSQLGQKAREVAEHDFQWDVIAEQIEHVYKEARMQK